MGVKMEDFVIWLIYWVEQFEKQPVCLMQFDAAWTLDTKIFL